MADIPEIRITNLNIRDIRVSDVMNTPPVTSSIVSPVVVNIGIPVIDMPGCVEAHEQNTNKQKSGILSADDPKGVKTYCDAGVPSFNALSFEPENLTYTKEAEVPPVKSPETPELPETPEIKPPPAKTAKIDCPTEAQQAKEPIGTFVNGFREKVIGYRLLGNECIQDTEPVPIQVQIIEGLPSGGQVVQVGGVAVIATASALLAKPLADLLLKAVKPAVKKVMKKISTLRGKTPPVQSVGQRRSEQRQMNHAVKVLRSVFPRKKKRKE